MCGGIGTRFDNVYPKPMNLVCGKPMIKYVVESLGVSKLYIFYHYTLESFGFKQYCINTFKNIDFVFIKIDYQTRGPAETVFTGLKQLVKNDIDTKEQVLVLDNDNIYTGLQEMFSKIENNKNFVLYNSNPTGLSHYSFINLDDNGLLTDIQERIPISEYVCVGGYGFESIQTALESTQNVIKSDYTDEFYMSMVVKYLLNSGKKVTGLHLPECYSIGTPKDILLNVSKLEKYTERLRIVFDLDNTIVTYPNIYKDYSTVEKHPHIISLIKQLKADGHYIIIHTARNMVSSNHNVGVSLKNIGLVTLETLKELDIPYDEIHFGKPYADIYIDDKSFNTFDISLPQQLGFYHYDNNLLSLVNPNKHNQLVRVNKNTIRKIGKFVDSEVFYYNQVLSCPTISNLFPKVVSHDTSNSFVMEYINGTLLFKIYSEGLLSTSLFYRFLDTVVSFHAAEIEDCIKIDLDDLRHHYMFKFEQRSLVKSDYPFNDFEYVKNIIQKQLDEFLKKNYPINSIIHGDLWFSNVMLYKQQFKFFDVRGRIGEICTIKGHTIYDWSKIYQSILGLDHIIHYGTHIPKTLCELIEDAFWKYLLSRNVIQRSDIKYIKNMTGYLLYNTFHSYTDDFPLEHKKLIWELVKECINN